MECERTAYAAEDAAQAGGALLAKAACCIADARYEDALDALERVPMFAVSEFERHEIVQTKILCSILCGDSVKAEAYKAEKDLLMPLSEEQESALTGIESLSRKAEELLEKARPKEKTEMTAILRGIVAPFGHTYTGHGKRGLRYALYNTATAAFMVAEVLAGNYITGLLGGSMILYKTFYLEELNVAGWVEPYNAEQLNSAKVSVSEAMAEDLKETFAEKYNQYVRRETGKEAGAESR